MKTLFVFVSLLALAFALPVSSPSQVSGDAVRLAQNNAGNTEEEKVEEIGAVEEVSPVSRWDSNNFPVLDRGVNLLTPRTLRKNSFLIVIEHRTRQEANKDSFDDFLGYDAGGLKIGLGLRYGVLDNLETGFYRLNGTLESFDSYDFDIKYRLLKENSRCPGLALRSGVTWFAQKGAEDASGFFSQLLLSKTVFRRLTLGTGLLYHSESSNDLKSSIDRNFSAAIPAQLELRLNSKFALEFETASNIIGYRARDQKHQTHPIITTGLKILTNRHTFSIIVSNNQYMSADGIVANAGRAMNKPIVGFTITREIDL